MNLHAVVANVVASVNPMLTATWMQSTGYTTSDSGKRSPTYATVTGVQLQLQALSARDLEHLDGLNIQNVTRKAWVFGSAEGVNRPEVKGGDLFLFAVPPSATVRTWLVSVVFETWDQDGPWSSVGLTLQND